MFDLLILNTDVSVPTQYFTTKVVNSYLFILILFSDQNTWEPVENMAACDKLVETFERSLARQKAMQQKQAAQLAQQKLNQGGVQKSMIKVVKTTAKPDELSQPGPSGLTPFEGLVIFIIKYTFKNTIFYLLK